MKLRWYNPSGDYSRVLQYFSEEDNEWLDIPEVYDEDYYDHRCSEHCPEDCDL